MAVSKSLRFQVLRRDNHTCRYCGRSAPEVRITVDHVVPETLGGPDTPENLVAACSDCNSGKSATPPDAALVAQVQDDALRWSAAVRAVAQEMTIEVDRRDQSRVQFEQAWQRWQFGARHAPLPAGWRDTVDTFAAVGLPMPVLLECVDIAMGRGRIDVDSKFRYMCGIAWRKVSELQTAAGASLRSPANSDDEEERIWESEQPGRADLACQLLAELEHEEIMSWLDSARLTFDEDDLPTEHQVQIEAAHLLFKAYRSRLRMAEAALYELVHSFPLAYTSRLTTEARAFFHDIGDDDPSTLSVLARVARWIAEQQTEER